MKQEIAHVITRIDLDGEPILRLVKDYEKALKLAIEIALEELIGSKELEQLSTEERNEKEAGLLFEFESSGYVSDECGGAIYLHELDME